MSRAWSIGVTESAQRRLQLAVVRAAGCEAGVIDRTGTTPAPDPERSGLHRVACYQVGRHAVLWCDPAEADRLDGLTGTTSALTDDAFRTWASESGGDIIGQAVMKTATSSSGKRRLPRGRFHRFDWDSPDDVELMRRFVDACDPEDLGEAEIALDALDAMAIGLLDNGGSVGAYASSRPFEYDASFGDIGVLVRADLRARGWGRSVVAGLIDEVLIPAGVEPLYRCDPENVGSDRLSRELGFETVISLTAAQFPGE